MKISQTLLGLLVLSAYAGCAYNQPPAQTMSYISYSQEVPPAMTQQSADQPQTLPVKNIMISTPDGEVAFHAQVADTDAAMLKGLMYYQSLPQNDGMIFVFDHAQPLTFWMKNTLIPLDMIFMDSNWKIVSIQKNVQPCKADPCATYPSGELAQYVLEINAGLSDKLGIQAGATANLQ